MSCCAAAPTRCPSHVWTWVSWSPEPTGGSGTGVSPWLRRPLVSSVRGVGLWLGVVLTAPVSAEVEVAAREAGFLLNAPAPDVLRLAPPLVLTEAQVDAFRELSSSLTHDNA